MTRKRAIGAAVVVMAVPWMIKQTGGWSSVEGRKAELQTPGFSGGISVGLINEKRNGFLLVLLTLGLWVNVEFCQRSLANVHLVLHRCCRKKFQDC